MIKMLFCIQQYNADISLAQLLQYSVLMVIYLNRLKMPKTFHEGSEISQILEKFSEQKTL